MHFFSSLSQMYVRQKHAALYRTRRQRACRFLIKESNGPNDDMCEAGNMEKEVLSGGQEALR